MCDHHHNHNHQGCDHTPEEQPTTFNLFLKIDTERVECLNEVSDESAKEIFKSWEDRKDLNKFVESDCDPELLINIPFTGNVKLKAIAILGGEHDSHPKTMKLYKNIPNMCLDQTAKECDQKFELPMNYNDVIQLPVKVARFASVQHLSLHFPDNHGSENTKIYYIGLSGDFTPAYRSPILLANYELAANPADHKTKLYDPSGHMIS